MAATAPRRRHDLREVVDAPSRIVHTGAQWCYLSTNSPPWEAVYQHQQPRRLDAGCFAEVAHDPRALPRWDEAHADDPTVMILDSRTTQNTPVGGGTGF